MRASDTIVLATSNTYKIQEIKEIFKKHPSITLRSANDIIRNADSLGLHEKFTTYYENALAKARAMNKACHYPILADDSGLEVDALQGAPGIFSARYAQQAGYPPTSTANVKLLLENLQAHVNRKACLKTTIVFMMEGVVLHAEGTLNGSIALQPQGDQGFGYDSVFIPQEHQQSLAELSLAEKCAISHRAQAFNHLFDQMQRLHILLARP